MKVENLKFKTIKFKHNNNHKIYKMTPGEYKKYLFDISKNNVVFIEEYLNMNYKEYAIDFLGINDLNAIAKNYNVEVVKVKYNLLCDNNIHDYYMELMDKQCLIPDHFYCSRCGTLKYKNTMLLDEKELRKPVNNITDRLKHFRIKTKLFFNRKVLKKYSY